MNGLQNSHIFCTYLSEVQAVGVAVHQHDLRRAFEGRRIGCHQPYGACPVDHHRLARLDARQLGGVVARRPDIGERGVVVFFLLSVFG